MSSVPSKHALKRLAAYVRALMGDTLADHGFFYRHSQSNVLHGQAVIVGAPETPYACGCYIFDFAFPHDYPHRPPIATFRTTDPLNRTRFNPNTYRNGKVCLSVLNTWQGDQWTGCQTISSVLLAIKANIFAVPEPLLNEPGVGRDHADFNTYHDIVRFKNLQIAVWHAAVQAAEAEGALWPSLRPIVARVFIQTGHGHLLSQLRPNAKAPPIVASTSVYDMKAKIDPASLLADVLKRGPGLMPTLEKMATEAEIDV